MDRAGSHECCNGHIYVLIFCRVFMVLAQIILKNIVLLTNLATLYVFFLNGVSKDLVKGLGNAVTLNHLEPNT